MTENVSDYLTSGDLTGWIEHLVAAVKAAPGDAGARFALGQALMVAGDYERADNHMDLAMNHDTSWGPKISLVRHMLRAMKSRDECFSAGRAPEVLKTPEGYLALLLKANAAFRDGDSDLAASLFEEAEGVRPAISGTKDGAAFEDFRDLDDRTAGILEIVTSNGKYYWIETSTINEMTVAPVSGLRDTILRQVEIDIEDGPSGVVFVPSVYWSADQDLDDKTRLGQLSDWSDDDRPPVTGVGRRCMMIGEEMSAFGEDGRHFIFNA